MNKRIWASAALIASLGIAVFALRPRHEVFKVVNASRSNKICTMVPGAHNWKDCTRFEAFQPVPAASYKGAFFDTNSVTMINAPIDPDAYSKNWLPDNDPRNNLAHFKCPTCRSVTRAENDFEKNTDPKFAWYESLGTTTGDEYNDVKVICTHPCSVKLRVLIKPLPSPAVSASTKKVIRQ